MPSTIASGSSWVFHLRSPITLAVTGLLAASASAAASGSGDCNNNGIPDAAEIAAGLVEDCNGNGVPDRCEYAKVAIEAETNPFGSGSPLVVPLEDATPAVSRPRIAISVRTGLEWFYGGGGGEVRSTSRPCVPPTAEFRGRGSAESS